MGLNIRLDFKDCYDIEQFKGDVPFTRFFTELSTGEQVSMGVFISEETHPLMPDVYNLAFGPLDHKNNIDDHSKISHKNYSKLFSTVVFVGIKFLLENEDKFLGIDGSNNARAYLYYRCIQNNHEYLEQFFKLHGANYYVRVLRKDRDEDPGYPIDAGDMIARLQPIMKEDQLKYDRLYNYFVFSLSTTKASVYDTVSERPEVITGTPG